MGEHDDNLIIDSRLAFHWMPQAFKVFLKLDTHTAAERIFTHIQEEGRVSQHAQSIEDVQHDIEIRDTSDRKRYQALYNVDYSDERHFDLVIDTGITDLETSAQLIVEKYHEWLTR
jgi:cytidylate kinase